MSKTLQPFFTFFNEEDHTFLEHDACDVRKLSDLKGYFQDEAARKEMEQQNDRIVYRVYKRNVPTVEGELLHCVTVIEPGDVNGEFFMTKGHYHLNENCAEIYYGQKGQGLLLLQYKDVTKTIEMTKGTVAYIPGGWGHRTVNISGAEPFVFFSVWPGQSGYNYERVLSEPFQKKVFKEGNRYVLR